MYRVQNSADGGIRTRTKSDIEDPRYNDTTVFVTKGFAVKPILLL